MLVWVQWVSFGLAIVGSLSGIYALILNHQRTTVINRQEKERLEKKRKAKFSVSSGRESRGPGTQNMFYLKNIGENEARNVSVKFYKDTREFSPLDSELQKTINSGQSVKAPLRYGGIDVSFEVLITWDDDFKTENELRELVS